MREALVGPSVVLEHAVLDHHAVLVRDHRIEAVLPISELPSELSRRELGAGWLTPGLVDIHTHGAAGAGFHDGQADSSRRALTGLLHGGVTSVLPSLATAAVEDLVTAIQTLHALSGSDGLPRTPGVHLEGPYFSHEQRGAQDPAHLRSPDDGSVSQLLELAPAIAMMSFAPELPGAVQLTERLVAADIVAAAGHSDCRDTDLEACRRAGLTHVIHVYSGQSTTRREGPWRQPGLLEATLASDDLTVEMIGDGKHLPPTLMRLAHRCLAGRLCLVSDSTPGAGMPDGSRYTLAGLEYLVEDGVGVTADRTAFGGSTTLLSQMIPIAMATLGLDVVQAVAMATAVPARAAGLDDVGRLAAGAWADFALFSPDMTLKAVAVNAQWTDLTSSSSPER